MIRSGTLVVALLLAAAFTWGVLHLLGVRFAAGDVYPEYSSLRTDPVGSKLLFDSLARLPGLTVTRNYVPLEYAPLSHATVLLLAIKPSALRDQQLIGRLELLAAQGNRVVAAFTPQSDKQAGDLSGLAAWHIRLVLPKEGPRVGELYFADAAGWTVLDRVGEKLFAVERTFGQGQIVLFADSDPFANGSSIAMDRVKQVSSAMGANHVIVFDETHFGIAESGSVMGLARRYRLMGLALGLAICAALVLWRSASAFPLPATSSEPEHRAGRTSFAGLVTLLRRHVPPQQIASVCWQEWSRSNRNQVTPEQAERAAAIAGAASGRPLEAVHEIQAVLRAKGAH